VGLALDQGFAAGILPDRPTMVNLQSDIDHPTQSMGEGLPGEQRQVHGLGVHGG